MRKLFIYGLISSIILYIAMGDLLNFSPILKIPAIIFGLPGTIVFCAVVTVFVFAKTIPIFECVFGWLDKEHDKRFRKKEEKEQRERIMRNERKWPYFNPRAPQ